MDFKESFDVLSWSGDGDNLSSFNSKIADASGIQIAEVADHSPPCTYQLSASSPVMHNPPPQFQHGGLNSSPPDILPSKNWNMTSAYSSPDISVVNSQNFSSSRSRSNTSFSDSVVNNNHCYDGLFMDMNSGPGYGMDTLNMFGAHKSEKGTCGVRCGGTDSLAALSRMVQGQNMNLFSSMDVGYSKTSPHHQGIVTSGLDFMERKESSPSLQDDELYYRTVDRPEMLIAGSTVTSSSPLPTVTQPPSVNVARPKSGRAKTNAELKKQLMERREQLRLLGLIENGGAEQGPTSPTSLSMPGTVSPSVTVPASPPCSLSSVNKQSPPEQPPKWGVGDMLWSKVSGHPWWPCMISPDPHQSVFTKLVPRRPNCMIRQYHVLFFGDEGERGWILESSSMPYAGRAAFEHHCQAVTSSANIKDRRNFVIPPNRRRAWEIAVSSAEHAWMLTKEQRLEEFMPPSTPQLPTYNRFFSGTTVENPCLPIAERNGRMSADTPLLNSSSPRLRAASSPECSRFGYARQQSLGSSDKTTAAPSLGSTALPAAESSFAAFSRAHWKSVCDAHPGYTADEINSLLKNQWRLMDDASKSKYIISWSMTNSSDCQDNYKCSKVAGCHSVDRQNSSPTVPSPEVRRKRGRPAKAARTESVSPGATLISPQTQMVPLLPPGSLAPELSGTHVDICRSCENPANESASLVICSGSCRGVFHTSCMQHATSVVPFICDECRTGNHLCFTCRNPSTPQNVTKRCSVPNCNYFYHESCMKSGRCSRHVCAACETKRAGSISEKSSKTNGVAVEPFKDLYQCIRCPTAYHTSYQCLAAGCQIIGGLSIICSQHVVLSKVHSHISASWCLSCDKGGLPRMVHCVICPASYHGVCLGQKISMDRWTCPDCSRGCRPRYGDVVWVKYSNYRWWPGQICYPEYVPLNIRDLPHDIGQFAVYFFGTRDYLWTHHGRVLPYHGDDKGCLEQPTTSKSLARVFQKALKEAREAYSLWQAGQENFKTKSTDLGRDQLLHSTDNESSVELPVSGVATCENLKLSKVCNEMKHSTHSSESDIVYPECVSSSSTFTEKTSNSEDNLERIDMQWTDAASSKYRGGLSPCGVMSVNNTAEENKEYCDMSSEQSRPLAFANESHLPMISDEVSIPLPSDSSCIK